ncbi:MAG: O-methyltransferase [Actinobacteria bacterium]|nr:O-methyltransferase [Actinomycetota bacterium]
MSSAMGSSAGSSSAHEWAAHWMPEDDILRRARAKAEELGCQPVDSLVGATLRGLAASVRATAVIEVGTGTGVSGTWLLRGMAAHGVLTTVDYEAEHQRVARGTFTEAAVPPQRTRVINGRAADVLTRMTPAGYDIAFIDADPLDYAQVVPLARGLVRPGGLLIIDDALAGGNVADPARRDPETIAIRDMMSTLRDDADLVATVLPIGAGLLVAVVGAFADNQSE